MPAFPKEKPPQPRKRNLRRTTYNDFTGVDYVHDAYTCQPNKCPELVNMISYTRGILEGRKGYEVIHRFNDSINCIAYGYVNNQEVILVHSGTKLYKLSEEPALLFDGLPNSKSEIFFALRQERFLIPPEKPVSAKTLGFIITGEEYYYIDFGDTITVAPVTSIATTPTVIIGRKPTGGGATLQPVNLLQPKRSEKFLGDGATKIFQLSAKKLDTALLEIKEITATDPKTYTENAAGALGFTVNRETGVVSFNTAPPKEPVTGEENIYITYSKTVEGYADRIKKCRSSTSFGIGGATRIFVTRNANQRSYDWWSEVQDPTYFPDLNYGIVGNDNSAIMGYLKFYNLLAIVKEDNSQDTSIYLREGKISEDKTYFFTSPGITGVGAISPYAFVHLSNEPVFLSRSGITAITTNLANQAPERLNRSYWIDPRLTKEPNLKEAIGVEWKGLYLLSLNDNTYVLDGRATEQVDYQKQTAYPAYFWTGFSPTCYFSKENDLYFGTADGKLCRFRDKGDQSDYLDDTEAIEYLAATKQDDDGEPSYKKTMTKKGNAIALKPYLRSSVDVFINTNFGTQNKENPLTLYSDKFDFNNIDFQRISFVSNDFTQPKRFPLRVKKYDTLQFVLRCKKAGETFALVSLTKQFFTTSKQISK